MHVIVKVALATKPGMDGILSTLKEVPCDPDIIYFDSHANGATFLVKDSRLDYFADTVKNTINSRHSAITISKTKCGNDAFLIIIRPHTSSLRQLDDDRANRLWDIKE